MQGSFRTAREEWYSRVGLALVLPSRYVFFSRTSKKVKNIFKIPTKSAKCVHHNKGVYGERSETRSTGSSVGNAKIFWDNGFILLFRPPPTPPDNPHPPEPPQYTPRHAAIYPLFLPIFRQINGTPLPLLIIWLIHR